MSRSLLLKRPNLLAYPGTAPGFDPSHFALSGPSPVLSVVNGVMSISPLPRAANSISGYTFPTDIIGPSSLSNGNNGGFIFDDVAGAMNTGAAWPVGTVGAIFRTGANAGGPGSFGCILHMNVGGFFMLTNSGGPNTLNLVGNGGSVDSGLLLTGNTPYFAAMSFNAALNVQNFVLVNLQNGVITSSAVLATSPVTSGSFFPRIYLGNDVNGNTPLGGPIACAMAQQSYASIATLRQWAADPWSFWYPQKFDLLQAVAVQAAADALMAQMWM